MSGLLLPELGEGSSLADSDVVFAESSVKPRISPGVVCQFLSNVPRPLKIAGPWDKGSLLRC